MNYSEIVGITRERNRPSGGIKTIHEVITNASITSQHKVLEVGSNTGFTSVNLSLLTGCEVIGIDTNDTSIAEASRYAQENKVRNKVSFTKASALDIPFDNQSFDFIWVSNVTSFINDKNKALGEYLRVLKTGGTLIFIPIYYYKKPPVSIVSKISKAIGAKIQVWDKKYWVSLINESSFKSGQYLELIYEQPYRYKDVKRNISKYIEVVFDKKHLRDLPRSKRATLKKEYGAFMELFNENLKYAEYSILLFQKRLQKEEIELFTTCKINI